MVMRAMKESEQGKGLKVLGVAVGKVRPDG